MAKIVVSSSNPAKINATLSGFQQMLPNEVFEIKGITVETGVSSQPLTEKETFTGALNRINAIKKLEPSADFWVAIEGGLEKTEHGMSSIDWGLIESKDGMLGKAKSSVFFLPDSVLNLVEQGYELSKASDIVFKKENTKSTSGIVGILTDNLIDKTKHYIDIIILALIPFKNREIY